jgi:hypothetical protein
MFSRNEFLRFFPAASESTIARNVDPDSPEGALCPARPEQAQAPALVSPVAREAKSFQRIGVRLVFCRVHLWHDKDNYASAGKDLLDGLRHAGLIPGDSEEQIDLEVEQRKTPRGETPYTLIEIEYPC